MTRTRSWLLAGAIIPAFVLPQAGLAQPLAAPAGAVELAQAPAPGDDQPGRGPRGGRGGPDAERPDQPRRERAPGVPRAPDAPRGPAAERPASPAAPGAERPAAPRPPAGAAPQPDRTPPMPRGVPPIVAPDSPGRPAARPTPVPPPDAPPAVRPTPPRPPGADIDQPRRAAPPAAAPAAPAPPAAAPAPAQRTAPGTAPPNAPAPQTAPAPAQRPAPGATPGTAPLNAPAPQTAPTAPRTAPATPPPPAATPAQPAPRAAPATPPATAPGAPPAPGVAPAPQTAPVPPAGRAPGAAPPAATPPAPGQTLAPPPAGQPPQATPGQIAPGQAAPGQPPAPDQRQGRRGGIGLGGAAAIGLGAGVIGGIMATQGADRLDDVRSRREERREGDVTIIREPGRTIIRDDDGRAIIRRDETRRFRDLGLEGRTERRGGETRTVFERPDGTRVVTITDEEGRLIRRTRQTRGGEEFVIIDNTRRDRPERGFSEEVVVLERPALRIPRERYIVDAESADRDLIYETITAPPLAPLPRRYTLDEVRYSPDLRAQMRSVDIDSITFETASWEVSRGQAGRLQVIAESLRRALQAAPNEVFLVEGHTDAVGPDVDNLSLSDRRAQAVAEILTRDFQVPPENLTTQGYGEQYLKVNTQGDSRENRRVTLRRITPLLAGQNAPQ